MHENIQLGIFLPSIGIHLDKTPSPTPGPGSSSNVILDGRRAVIDTAIAFIKAYRLKGDAFGMKQAVLSAFDSVSLSDAYKSLWDTSSDDLLDCGLTFHTRRSLEKRQLTNVLLAY